MLFFIFLRLIVLTSVLSSGTNNSEQEALLNLKQRVSDPLGTLFTWNESTDLCSGWKGIACSYSTRRRVTSLRLQSLSSLSTSLLASVTETLSDLHELSVIQSSFNDSIDEFNPGSCTSLELVNLYNNRLHGNFPYGLTNTCKQVRLLNISHNRLEGELQGDAFTLTNSLETLDVSDNNLTGPLSPRLFQTCESLRHLNLSNNGFTGVFPDLSSFAPSLEFLHASFNSFTGELPMIMGGLGLQVKHLDLSSNSFTYTSTASLCSPNVTKLEALILANNRLTGAHFLTSILDCRRLAMLDVSFNNLTGELPEDLCGRLPNLASLVLTMNRLQGLIPSTLSSCTKLIILLLGYNNLQGHIPSELSQLSNLWWLDLNNNNFSGKIPSSFGLFQGLVGLFLNGNSLHGEIPRELADCSQLVLLELGGNSLTGSIPPYLGRRETVTNSVNRDDYHLVGSIGDLRMIQVFPPKCEFNGIIGTFLAQGITVEKLQERVRERSSCPNVRLALEPSYRYTASSLVYLDLSDNQLTGAIPAELGEMQTLFLLDLRHNLLSGGIPPELGKLRQIQVLDLSYNGLEGEIPVSIGDLTFLKILNISYNNLSGPIPQTGQLTTFFTSYIGNPGLCGQPVTPNCSSYRKGSRDFSPSPTSSGDGLKADVLAIGFVFGLLSFTGCYALVYFRPWKLLRWEPEILEGTDTISSVSQTRSWAFLSPSEALKILYRRISAS